MSMAIITGASSGLGREFVRAVREQRPEIDEFVLIARRRERMEALAAEMPDKKTTILPLDLASAESYDALARFLQERRPEVELLINNAGYGILGDMAEGDVPSQAGMVTLNCGALTALCTLVLPYIRRGGVIINVSSIASFVPTPRMAVYGATKSFGASLSRALREELKARRINVLALCPAPMDTEFLDVAGISGGHSKTFDTLPHISASLAADGAVRQAFRGRAVYTPTFFYKFYRVLAKLLPHAWLVRLTKC